MADIYEPVEYGWEQVYMPSAEVADGSVTSEKLAGQAVTIGKVANEAIMPMNLLFEKKPAGSDENKGKLIEYYSKDTFRLADPPSAELADGSVTSAKLAAGSVSAPKLADRAVGGKKLGTLNGVQSAPKAESGQVLSLADADLGLLMWVDPPSGGGVSLSDVYPVGSIYMNYGSSLPAAFSQGMTWEKVAEGTFLAAAGSSYAAGSTGGSNDASVVSHSHTASTDSKGGHWHQVTVTSAGSHTHTATTNMSGSHSHDPSTGTGWFTKVSSRPSPAIAVTEAEPYWYAVAASMKDAGTHGHTVTVRSDGGHTHSAKSDTDGAHTHAVTVASAGSSGAGKNMPKYLAVSMWRRTK